MRKLPSLAKTNDAYGILGGQSRHIIENMTMQTDNVDRVSQLSTDRESFRTDNHAVNEVCCWSDSSQYFLRCKINLSEYRIIQKGDTSTAEKICRFLIVAAAVDCRLVSDSVIRVSLDSNSDCKIITFLALHGDRLRYVF